MKRIALTQEKYALVDDEDFERLNQFKWYAHENYRTFYAQRMSPTINGKRCLIYMHHEIVGKPFPNYVSDHENGNGLDNQRENLRFITHRQSAQNRKRVPKTSQYMGVHWKKDRNKWQAAIRINGLVKYLGLFINEKEAFEAYRQAVEAIGEEVIS